MIYMCGTQYQNAGFNNSKPNTQPTNGITQMENQ